jgi:hypothetical protein
VYSGGSGIGCYDRRIDFHSLRPIFLCSFKIIRSPYLVLYGQLLRSISLGLLILSSLGFICDYEAEIIVRRVFIFNLSSLSVGARSRSIALRESELICLCKLFGGRFILVLTSTSLRGLLSIGTGNSL